MPDPEAKWFLSDTYRLHFEQSVSEICLAVRNSSLFIEGKSEITEALLYSLVIGLRTYYQKYYGRGSPRPRPITIPHSRLFDDFSVCGSLHTIISSLLVGATVRNIPISEIFELDTLSILPILYEIEKSLFVNNQWYSPSLFLNKVPVHYVNKLSRIILRHGGILAAREDVATHIVDWIEELDSPNESSEYSFRHVKTNRMVNQSGTILHWNFWPDSYDEVSSSADSEVTSLANNVFKHTYLVSCRFIIDCDEFNEWGNEVDYEIPPEEIEDITSDAAIIDTTSSKRTKQKKRGTQGSSQLLSRLAKESVVFQAKSFQDKFFADVTPQNMLQLDLSSKSCVMDISSSSPDLVLCKEVKTDLAIGGLKRKFEQEILKVDADFDNNRRSWISMESISSVEFKYMNYVINSFTSGNESSYIQLRNSIINLYVQSPSQYLSATECRRKLSGDVGKILRIHEFLDAFSVINYSVKFESRPHDIENYGIVMKRKVLVERLRNYGNFSSQNCSKWDLDKDQYLLRAVSSHKMDWNAVAANMHQFNVTPLDCMARFLEISLGEVPDVPFSTSNNVVTEDLKENNQQSSSPFIPGKHLLIVHVRKILHMIDSLKSATVRLDQNNSVESEVVKNLALRTELRKNITAAYDLSEHCISGLITELKDHNQDFLRDYLYNRIESVEQRVKAFKNMEIMLKHDNDATEISLRQLSLKLTQALTNSAVVLNSMR